MHFSVKLNKSRGYYEINFNVIKKRVGSLHKPLLRIFNQSLQNWIFPDEMKIARVTPLFKKGSDLDLVNYRPICITLFFKSFWETYVQSSLQTVKWKRVTLQDTVWISIKTFNRRAILQLID